MNKSTMTVMTSSKTDVWATPQDTFDALDREFHFETDVCALPENAKCRHFFSPEQDGLQQAWAGVCWMNPPYGRTIGHWIRMAYESSIKGATVVCLIPARTDTRWWHDYVKAHASAIRYVKGRLKFGNATAGAPFASAVVVFSPRVQYVPGPTHVKLRRAIQALEGDCINVDCRCINCRVARGESAIYDAEDEVVLE